MSVKWSYFDKFNNILDKYMLISGEGETKASQTVTAVSKLIYKWYNDGDVFDNTHYLDGWANDLSSYANWLYEYADADNILNKIADCVTESDYEDLLKELADKLLDEKYLAEQNKDKKIDSIYSCEGKFRFVDDYYNDDEDHYDYDEYDDDEEDEDDEE